MPQVKFVQAPEYVETYATSVWGGLGPKGDLKITFTEDRFDFPEIIELVDSGGGMYTEPPMQSVNMIRQKKCTVTVPVLEIPSIILWLQNKFSQYQALNPNIQIEVHGGTPEETEAFCRSIGINGPEENQK